MPHRVSFFTYSEWDSDRACMAFIALVDGRRVRCLIRSEALVELAQKDAASPILTFAEHRPLVEELARDLIQKGRLDGSELMIRLSDVAAAREAQLLAAPAVEAPPAAPAESLPAQLPATEAPATAKGAPQGADGVINGRTMTIAPADCEQLWQTICDRQKNAAERGAYSRFPDLARRAQDEAQSFAGQPAPASAHELNMRRVEASRMVTSWSAELMQQQG